MLRAEVATRDPGARRQIKAALEAQSGAEARGRVLAAPFLIFPFPSLLLPLHPPLARSAGKPR